jgi:hypothetical protein
MRPCLHATGPVKLSAQEAATPAMPRGRPKKAARTQQLLIGTHSDLDLARFGKIAAAQPPSEPETHHASRTHISEALKDDEKLLGLTLQMPSSNDGDVEWKLLEPNVLVAHVVGSCPQLQDAYAEAVKRSPPTLERPWDLMVCYDEFAPGNKLAYDNTRKTMVLSFNFEQLGNFVLQKDYSWMVPIIVRTSKMKTVLGGWSHMLRRFFHVMLLGTHGGATVGITVMINGLAVTLHSRVKYLGSDYDGIRIGWDWKGANSLRSCLRCSNVFKKGSDLASRVENGVETICVDKSQLIERTSEDFEYDVDLVTEAGDQYAEFQPDWPLRLQEAPPTHACS